MIILQIIGIIVGAYILYMLFVAIVPVSRVRRMPASQSIANESDTGANGSDLTTVLI